MFRILFPDPNKFALHDPSIYDPDTERLVWKLVGIVFDLKVWVSNCEKALAASIVKNVGGLHILIRGEYLRHRLLRRQVKFALWLNPIGHLQQNIKYSMYFFSVCVFVAGSGAGQKTQKSQRHVQVT